MRRNHPSNRSSRILAPLAIVLALTLVGTPTAGASVEVAPNADGGIGRTTIEPSSRVAALIDQMTLGEKLSFVSPTPDPLGLGNAGYIPGVARLGIPELRLTDGTAGIRLNEPATALPVPVMLGSTFDPDLAYDYGNAMGHEGRALQQDVLLAPMVNVIRVPQGGRNFETFSEDPLVTAQIAGAEVAGVQDAGMIATAKHYALNNQEANKNSVSVDITDQALHEVYLPGYAAAIEAGAGAVMCAYNKVGDAYSCGSDDLLNNILKTKLDFQGWVMSDWGVTHSPNDLMAGLDQEMYWIGQQTSHFTDKLQLLLDDGTIPVSALDDAVARILGQMEEAGLLDGAAENRPELDTATTEAVAQRVAEEGAVLLKNADNALPLSTGGSIALFGRTAQEAKVGGSGSASMAPGTATSPLDAITERAGAETTVEWDSGLPEGTGIPAAALGNPAGFPFNEDGVSISADLSYSGTLNIAETGTYSFSANAAGGYAVVNIDGAMVVGAMGGAGGGTVELTAGAHSISLMGGGAPGAITFTWITPGAAAAAFQDAADQAADADVAIVFAYDETSVMADRPNLALPAQQDSLVSAVAAANPNTVVVLNTGSALTMPWIDDVAAVLNMYYPGVNGAEATARLLYGDVNPSGKLTQTFPASDSQTPIAGDSSAYPGVANVVKYSEGIDVGYRWYARHKVTPLFPFGYGLSYTSFEYSEASATQVGDQVVVQVTLTNTGDRAGSEVAQVYAGPTVDVEADQPVRKLVGFSKVALEPGEAKVVQIPLDLHQFEYWDETLDGWQLGEGKRRLTVGGAAGDPAAVTTTVTVTSPDALPNRDVTALQALIDGAEQAVKGGGFTVESLAALNSALAEAKAVVNDEQAGQEQVDATVVTLAEAIAALRTVDSNASTTTTLTVPGGKLALNAKGQASLALSARVVSTSTGQNAASGSVKFTVGGRSVTAPVSGGVATARLSVARPGVFTAVAQYQDAGSSAFSVGLAKVKVAKAGSNVKVKAKKTRKAVQKAVRTGKKKATITLSLKVAGKAKAASGNVRIKGKGLKATTVRVKNGKAKVKVTLTKAARKRVKVKAVFQATPKVKKSTSKPVTIRAKR